MGLSPTLADPGTDDADVSPRTNTILKAIMVMAILGMVAFWAWIFAGGPTKANPDFLGDRAYAARTATRCQRMVDEINRLPPAATSHTAPQRAAVVDQATAIITSTVDEIEATAPRSGDDALRLHGWIADWRTYLRDRRDYTVRLRQKPRAQLLFDKNPAGDPIDQPIKEFADVNDIPSCDPPGDIG